MEYAFPCPKCGEVLMATLIGEITPIQCTACGEVFGAARPEAIAAAQAKKAAKKAKAAAKKKTLPLTMMLLEAADDNTSNAVIAAYSKSAAFRALSQAEMESIVARDQEDDEKLAEGIALAIAKQAVPPKNKLKLEKLNTIDVLGKSADEVAAEIVAALGDAPDKGCVLILQGLSGTGKGTTVAKLQSLLPRASCWSNGNIFRALTLLAVTYCEAHGIPFSADALSPGLLSELVKCDPPVACACAWTWTMTLSLVKCDPPAVGSPPPRGSQAHGHRIKHGTCACAWTWPPHGARATRVGPVPHLTATCHAPPTPCPHTSTQVLALRACWRAEWRGPAI